MRSGVRRTLVVFLVVTISGASTNISASWLSDLTGINVDVNEGKVEVNPPTLSEIPERVRIAFETLPEAIEGTVRDIFNPAGAALATAIRHARAQASRGAQGVPTRIRDELRGIVPDDVLNDARWNSLDKNHIDLAALTLLHNNDIAAVTVGHVIVFDRSEDAERNWRLWAHELFHTIQYSNMGIEGFAHEYITGPEALERPARDYATLVERHWTARRQGNEADAITYRLPSTTTNADRFFSAVQRATRTIAPATACLEIDDNNGTPTVTNVCNVPVWVTSFVEVDRNTGQRFRGRCYPGTPGISCEIPPGVTGPVVTPRRGCQEEVRFSFFDDGRNAAHGVWEGDCSFIEPMPGTTQSMGRSCCMFNGGRCGPFWDQLAGPVGAPCSCQYGNPNANGQVCPP